jgi:hypothetical protein
MVAMRWGLSCCFCGRQANDRWREMVAWEQQAEGSTRVVARRETGRRLCDECAVDLRTGIAPNSPRLF